MADIRDPERFMAGRWKWTSYGYEFGFPNKCQFTDIDAVVEFSSSTGRWLMIEGKHNDGVEPPSYPSSGQLRFLRAFRNLVGDDGDVFILYGVAAENEPWALRILGKRRAGDQFIDWRDVPAAEHRRESLKAWIDWSLGVTPR